MDQQDTSTRDDQPGGTPTQQQQPQAPRERPGADDTWGLGSSSALERLRERNYHGRRGGGDGRPSSE